MDLDAIMAMESQKEEAAQDERTKKKLKQEIRILNKEKETCFRKNRYEFFKQGKALTVLEEERDREVANYLATQSEVTERKYRAQENVVKDLVKTTDDVKQWLDNEMDEIQKLEKEIKEVDDTKWRLKMENTRKMLQMNTFRIPDELRMEKRVERAQQKFYQQLQQNIKLKNEVDSALFHREKFIKLENRLTKSLEDLNNSVSLIMASTTEIYEQRDRAESTKVKVQEHLSRVKDQYERDILNIDLQMSESKKMEHFMRTKHKDITAYLAKKREDELAAAKEMVERKDEFAIAFDRIKEATGKSDINEIVSDFIQQEEDNFATFMAIGEILDDCVRTRMKIAELQAENKKMEDDNLQDHDDCVMQMAAAKERIIELRKKSEAFNERLSSQNQTIDSFTGQVQDLIKILEVEKEDLVDYIGKEGEIKDTNLLACLTAIEKELASFVQDYTMVELSIRANWRSKHAFSADEQMVARFPSFHIPQNIGQPIRAANPWKDDLEDFPEPILLTLAAARDVAVKTMLTDPDHDKEVN